MNTNLNTARITAISVAALIILCAVWESVGAPLRSGGTLFAFKGCLLLPLLPALWCGQRKRFFLLNLLILLYVLEGSTRAFADTDAISRLYAIGEVIDSVLIFILANTYIKQTRMHSPPARQRRLKSRLIFWIVALICLQLLMPSVWRAQQENDWLYVWLRFALVLITVISLLIYLFRLYQVSQLDHR